eukprot:Lithocolla_globosa_v1_NODE_303_length_4589_cov_9.861240.p3 type:complete len:106 gc:universal NODE_303_length_4589_cov_9.861240:4052-4369(+)
MHTQQLFLSINECTQSLHSAFPQSQPNHQLIKHGSLGQKRLVEDTFQGGSHIHNCKEQTQHNLASFLSFEPSRKVSSKPKLWAPPKRNHVRLNLQQRPLVVPHNV